MNLKKHYTLITSFIVAFFLIAMFPFAQIEAKESDNYDTQQYQKDLNTLERQHKDELKKLKEKHTLKTLEERHKRELKALKERHKVEEGKLKALQTQERKMLIGEQRKRDKNEKTVKGDKEKEENKESWITKLKSKFKRDEEQR